MPSFIAQPSYDTDASTFFTTAGVTRTESRQQISRFVIGVKDLGFWGRMAAWPLRSDQNASSGLTAYSLGGLTTANATLTGGSWFYDGFLLSALQYGYASLPAQNQNLSLMLVAAGNGTSYSSFPQFLSVARNTDWNGNELAMGSNGSPSDCTTIVRNSTNIAYVGGTVPNSLSNSTSFTCLAASFQLGAFLTSKNYRTGATSSASAPTTGTSTLNRMQLNGRWNGISPALGNPMKVAFAAVFAPAILTSMDQVYALYKTTLGVGVDLP